MFYNRGEVLSDQFDHFQLISFWVPSAHSVKKIKENGITWEFFPQGGGGGGSSIPISTDHNTTQKVTFL